MAEPVYVVEIAGVKFILASTAKIKYLYKSGTVSSTVALTLEEPDGTDYQVPTAKIFVLLGFFTTSAQDDHVITQADAANSTTGEIIKYVFRPSSNNVIWATGKQTFVAAKFVNMRSEGVSAIRISAVYGVEVDA